MYLLVMRLFKTIKVMFAGVKCTIRVAKAIDKKNLIRPNEYERVIDFLTKYELVRHIWTKELNCKTEKQKIAVFALVFYLLELQIFGDPYFWADNQESLTDDEDELWLRISDLLENAMEDYKKFILNNSVEKGRGVDVSIIFDKYLKHLHKIDFINFLLSKEMKHLANKYLLVYLESDEFDNIDVMKDVIIIDDERGKINIKELENQIDQIVLKTPNLGLDFDRIQIKLVKLRLFCDTTLLTTFDNNAFFTMKANFN